MLLELFCKPLAHGLSSAVHRHLRYGLRAARACHSVDICPAGQRQTQGELVNVVDRRLRALLIQAAHRLIRTHDRWRALAMKLVRSGKPRSVAVAAVANRWMRTVHRRMTA